MKRLGILLSTVSVVGASLAAVVISAGPAAAALPTGFSDELIAGVSAPTAIDFTPDGRILITTQGGAVRVVKNGSLLPTAALNLSAQLCSNSERGLLGVAVDPQFATNGYVFLYYSFKKTVGCDSATVNRVSRFVMSGDTLSNETVLIDNIPSPAGNHNAGDLHFGKDQLLYVSVGDGGCDYASPQNCQNSNDAARDLNALVGKILRIDRNGGIPAANPFTGVETARCNVQGVIATNLRCQEIFATGLRNPFRTAFDPNAPSTRFYINDVGGSVWEEIDLGTVGADYGWNVREGHCAVGSTTNCGPPPPGMTNPIFDYGHGDTCDTITGGAFVPNGVWPAEYQGKYLFGDFGCGKIFRLDPNGAGGFTRVDFATGLGTNSAVHMAFGPWGNSQALYYTSYAGGGQVRRITHATAGTTRGDYDGDGDTDVAVFRPSTGTWFVQGGATTAFGTSGDVPVPADYDGDGDDDVAVFRPSTGTWFVQGGVTTAWGTSGDIPVPADYDGDGDDDIAVFRPSSGIWFVQGGTTTVFGTTGDVPVPADYDGDGDDDIAVFRPSTGAWFVQGGMTTVFGTSGDVAVPGDYDGDGDDDIAVFRPSVGVRLISGGATIAYGTSGDIALPVASRSS